MHNITPCSAIACSSVLCGVNVAAGCWLSLPSLFLFFPGPNPRNGKRPHGPCSHLVAHVQPWFDRRKGKARLGRPRLAQVRPGGLHFSRFPLLCLTGEMEMFAACAFRSSCPLSAQLSAAFFRPKLLANNELWVDEINSAMRWGLACFVLIALLYLSLGARAARA